MGQRVLDSLEEPILAFCCTQKNDIWLRPWISN